MAVAHVEEIGYDRVACVAADEVLHGRVGDVCAQAARGHVADGLGRAGVVLREEAEDTLGLAARGELLQRRGWHKLHDARARRHGQHPVRREAQVEVLLAHEVVHYADELHAFVSF